MNIKKVNVRLALSSLLLVSLLLTSCKDWDDHYEADSAVEGTATASLWENISSNSNLSQFAALVRKAGYEEFLKSAQTLTVWAPLNGTFDYEALSQESNDKVLKEFVQNHIARNNFPASGVVSKNVFMLNKKLLVFEGNGNYTMDGVAVAQPNVASSNGVIHTINGKLQFRFNILESLKADEFPIDSISEFIHSYDVQRLNESKSTQGPVVDGQLTYLDSVFDEYNMQGMLHYAYIDREDSDYTMIVPTNEAWVKAKNYIQKCYNYVNYRYYTYPIAASSKRKNTDPEEINIAPSAAYWKDSITNYMMLAGLFYNNNINDNVKLKKLQDGQLPEVDSLTTSDYGNYIYTDDAKDLFTGTTRQQKSNGAIYITDDSLRLRPWLIWNPIINVEAEFTSNQASVDNGSIITSYVYAGDQNEKVEGSVSNSGYATISPSTHTSNVEFNMFLPNVRSTTYVVYGVFVPANIVNTFIPDEDLKPVNIQVQVGVNRADGSITAIPTTLSYNGNSFFNNNPTKVDTVCFGEVTFPICYYRMEGAPYLRILSRVAVGNNNNDRTLRIDRVFLVPKELDEYMKEHPDYKPYYRRFNY